MTSLTRPANAPSDSDRPVRLAASELDCLKSIAGHMIPASAAYGVPGADDPLIFADMVASIARDGQLLRLTLQAVDEAAGGALSSLPPGEQTALLMRLRSDERGLLGVVEAIVSRAYYRDDRVLKSIGMEARPPYPNGYAVEQGDLSLLDPVRKRAAIYRDPGE